MFLIEIAPDELSHLKSVMDAATVRGKEAAIHHEIRKRLDTPIVGEKLIADIQMKARRGPQGGPVADPGTPPATPVAEPAPLPPPVETFQAFPLPAPQQQ